MRDRLKSLFDYQKFEQNNKLGELIEETENQYEMRMLSENDLGVVAAAGMPDSLNQAPSLLATTPDK